MNTEDHTTGEDLKGASLVLRMGETSRTGGFAGKALPAQRRDGKGGERQTDLAGVVTSESETAAVDLEWTIKLCFLVGVWRVLLGPGRCPSRERVCSGQAGS